MKAVEWWLRHLAARLGGVGMLALFLIAGSALAYLGLVRPDALRLRTLETREAALQARLGQTEQKVPDNFRPALPELPGENAWPAALGQIVLAAERQGLSLAQGEYRLTPDKSGKILRYQISLPLQGTYPQLRAFLDTVLTEVPGATLDEVGFRRDSIDTPQVEARVTLSLFFEGR
jgi:hypothetical protein